MQCGKHLKCMCIPVLLVTLLIAVNSCETYILTQLIVVLYQHMNKFPHVTYIWHLRTMFVSGTHLAIIYELAVAVGCILVEILKNIGPIFQFTIVAM